MMDREWVRAAKDPFNVRSRMTANFQGWLFLPEGAHKPDSRIWSTTSSETGSLVNWRTDLLVLMAAITGLSAFIFLPVF
jgi:hypothetical protein